MDFKAIQEKLIAINAIVKVNIKEKEQRKQFSKNKKSKEVFNGIINESTITKKNVYPNYVRFSSQCKRPKYFYTSINNPNPTSRY